MSKFEFRKHQQVTAVIPHRSGTTTIAGKIVGFPAGTGRGQNRYTVKDANGKEWRPYASQITAVETTTTTASAAPAPAVDAPTPTTPATFA